MDVQDIEFIYDEFVHSFAAKIYSIQTRNIHEPKKICFHLIDDGFATEFPRYIFIAKRYPRTLHGKICIALKKAYKALLRQDDDSSALAKYRRVVDFFEFL